MTKARRNELIKRYLVLQARTDAGEVFGPVCTHRTVLCVMQELKDMCVELATANGWTPKRIATKLKEIKDARS